MAMRAVLRSIQFMGLTFIVAADTLFEVAQAPENTNSIAGANVAFNCTFPILQHDSDVDVHWWKLGENEFIQPDTRKRFLIEKGRVYFELRNISVQDSGVYHCGVIRRGNMFVNGSGSKLVVRAPPTPLRIVQKESESNVPVFDSLTLVCEMSSFYPDELAITWYKNNGSIETGIHTTKQLSRAGMYEASSFFAEAQPVQGGTVYVCLVAHVTLQFPAMVIYLVPNSNSGSDCTSPSPYLRIIGCAGFAMTFLVLLIIVGMSFTCSNSKGRHRKNEANNGDESK